MSRLPTSEVLKIIAEVAKPFREWLGEVTVESLQALIKTELGNENIFDGFQKSDRKLTRAIAPKSIYHVFSGNTPHAALQSLIRGLILQSQNFCKLPTRGIEEVTKFYNSLPKELLATVHFSTELKDEWLKKSHVLVAFGSDKTINHFKSLLLNYPNIRVFLPYGHKISFGIVFEDSNYESVVLSAKDIAAFDQRGCASPQFFLIKESAQTNARKYAKLLATELERIDLQDPRAKLSIEESAQILSWRELNRFLSANDSENYAIWESKDSTNWTVVYDAKNKLIGDTPTNRSIVVKPFPSEIDFGKLIETNAEVLSTIGIWPSKEEFAELLFNKGLKISRVCPIGKMQEPPLSWHQDGRQTLASMVTWVDFENGFEK